MGGHDLIAALLAAYLLVMRGATGNAFIFFKSYSRGVAVVGASPKNLLDLGGFGRAFLNVGSWHGMLDSALDRLWFVLLMPVLAKLWREDKTAFWYAVAMGVVPAMTQSFTDYTRYFLLVFPAFTVAGRALARPGREPRLWLSAGALFAVQLLLLRHVNYYWAG